jgi:hypothetical protein
LSPLTHMAHQAISMLTDPLVNATMTARFVHRDVSNESVQHDLDDQ